LAETAQYSADEGFSQKARLCVASFNASARLRAIFPPSGKLTIQLAAFLLAICTSLQAQTPAVHFGGAQSSFANPATYPYGLAVDKSGNIFVTDNDYDDVYEIPFANGTYSQSVSLGTFQQPWGIAVDGSDNVYIVENSTSDVIKETPTLTPYGSVWTQSVLPTTGLNSPYGIAVDNAGNVYIADGGNDRIVRETPRGNTYTQSIVPTSPVGLPEGIAVDGSGAIYFTDPAHARVLKETPSGTGYTESTVADNIPREAVGVAVDGSGNVFILDLYVDDAYGVLKETPSGDGYVQTTVALAGYQNPYGIAADASGDLYIDSPGADRLLKLAPFAGDIGMVNTGSAGSPVSLIFVFDRGGTIGTPEVLTQGAIGLDFTDAGTGTCTTQKPGYLYSAGDSCSIDIAFRPQFPGGRRGAGGLQDAAGNPLSVGYLYGTGVGPQAAFLPGRQIGLDIGGLVRPQGVAVDGGGNVFFAANGSGTIYKETRSGDSDLRTVVAGGLDHPTAVAVDGGGNLYVAAADGLFQETPLAGRYRQKLLISDLTKLTGVAVDGGGNLYITSSESGDVHKETLATSGGYTESGVGFGITSPGGVAVDGSGNIFVTDPHQGEVYQETPEADGSYHQTLVATGLAGPQSVAVDGGGNLYITGSLSGDVYKEAPDGNGGYVQSIAYGGLEAPWGIAADGRGNLYLSLNTPNGELSMIDVADPPVLDFAKTPVGGTSADSPQMVTLANIGNAALTVPVLSAVPNPSISAGFSLDAATTCPVLGATGADGSEAAGSACVYAINFIPVAPGPVRGALTLTDTSLNRYYPNFAMQRVELREGITSDATRTTLRVTPDQIKKGHGVTMTATVADTSVLSIVPEGGGVTFTDTLGGKAVVLNGGVPVPLSGGKAVLSMIPKAAGEHAITAHYGGVNASFASSTGGAALAVYP
jgi:sugar lactone lactonase YvrE